MSFTKVAPAGIGTSPGTSILIGDSLLHSTGIDIGSNTGIGVTIRKHGDATFTGIITASAFFGDGSGLEGVSSSGIGTALSDDDTSSLNKIYYANQELSIGSTVTVNHPDTGIAAYTHYQDLVVKDNADFIVADGDTFIPDVLGINTSSLPNPVSSATGGRIRAGTLTNAGANGAPNFPNGVTGTAATFTTGTFSGAITAASGTITGNLGVGGVLTYEDVTNIDSVGVITARDGLRVTGVTTITGTGEYLLRLNKSDSSAVYTQFTNSTSGTSTSDGFRIGMDSNEDGLVWLREDGNVKFGSNNSERLRIFSNGDIGVNVTTINRSDPGRNTVQFDYSGSDGSQGLEIRLSNSALNGNAATDNAAITYIGQTLGFTNRENGNIQFSNNGSERLRINSTGVVQVMSERLTMGTSVTNGGANDGNFCIEFSSASRNAIKLRDTHNTGSTTYMVLVGGSATVGSITGTTGQAFYNNLSDYRTKENDIKITDGIEKIKLLNPIRFNYKTDSSTLCDGFFAHEVTPAVPTAVTGEKDAVDSDGKIDPQMLDMGKIIPLLTAALQEAIAKIETLESKVATLEGS